MNPLARERRSRDTRPQPARRHPATPCKAAQPPPPPAIKRLALLVPLLALAAGCARGPVAVSVIGSSTVSSNALRAAVGIRTIHELEWRLHECRNSVIVK